MTYVHILYNVNVALVSPLCKLHTGGERCSGSPIKLPPTRVHGKSININWIISSAHSVRPMNLAGKRQYAELNS